MNIEKVMRIANAELATIEAEYEAILDEIRLAINTTGKKKEIETLRFAKDVAWARYETLSTFIKKVEAA